MFVKLSYLAYLMQENPESHSTAILLATEDGREPCREIVVKFVQRYNAEAHRLLAAAGLAPDIFYCSAEDPGQSSKVSDLAGLTMVVMGYIAGKTAHRLYGNQPLPQPIFDQVEKALQILLHKRNIVFGDLRLPNITITKDNDRARLIDFDWCGVHEEDTYPVLLNDARNTTNSIDWHPRGGRMMKEHDTYRFESMKPQSDPPLAITSISQTQLGKR